MDPARSAYRTSEVARMLGVSDLRVRRWVRRGELAGVKIAGNWFVLAEALAELLGAYDAERARSQRGEPLSAEQGRPLGGERDDAGRTPPVAIRRIQERRGDAAARPAATARPLHRGP